MGRMAAGRWWFLGMVGLSAYYALFGGEYSALETLRIRREAADAELLLAQLAVERDSLTARVDALEGDARTLETLARESFGMIREGEVLYRFADRAGDEVGGEAEGN
jgi:cell division protein FtsB